MRRETLDARETLPQTAKSSSQCMGNRSTHLTGDIAISIVLKRDLAITSDELNSLRRTAWDGPQHGGNWDPVFAHSLGWVCATDDDRSDHLIGFVNVAWDGDTHVFLLDTTVDREYQRRGIGRDLVLEAAALARERGVEWLHVDYEPELDSFYRSCGFRPTAAGLLNLTTAVVDDER